VKKIEKILFPSDLTSSSFVALEYALTFAKLYDADVYVLHVLDSTPYEIISMESPEMGEMFYRVEEQARTEMNKCLRESLATSTKIIQVMRCGDIQDEIIKFAEKENVDLIVMATFSWPGVLDLRSDSITSRIVNKTSIPVMSINKTKLVGNQPYITVPEKEFQLNTFGKILFN
jgi:nucleotide-binding universal stress UspA family protein